jgi:hypothetical protein
MNANGGAKGNGLCGPHSSISPDTIRKPDKWTQSFIGIPQQGLRCTRPNRPGSIYAIPSASLEWRRIATPTVRSFCLVSITKHMLLCTVKSGPAGPIAPFESDRAQPPWLTVVCKSGPPLSQASVSLYKQAPRKHRKMLNGS